ncbi:hypothetical protein BYT27DRAFT_7254873 [Phlegmacium glaucopus]|nr:hypothetical protein BYT27DRAFT_7254873 [Phlegmacium glaucopus]
MDKLSASARKERAGVKVQYGKKTKLRARASSIKGSTAKVPYGSPTSDAVLSTPLPVSTSSHRPSPYHKNKKGLVLHIATGPSSLNPESDESDLTSLSSSTLSLSPGMASPIDNDIPKPSFCTPPKAVPLTARLGLNYEQLPELNEPTWSANDLDSYVWVLLEPKSNHVYDPARDENDRKGRLWWPAKILSARNTDIPLKVSLFGSGPKKVEIKTPSVENVLSKLDMIGRPRFNKPTFVSASSVASHTPTASPRKKLKRDRSDVEKNWEAAVLEMVQDGEEQAGSDHLPDIGEAFNYHFDATSSTTITAPVGIPTSMGKGKNKWKGKRKRTCESDDEGFWESPPADSSLDIPGELVLGRDKVSKLTAYWPAKIKNYVPPTKRMEQGKYTVVWLDGSEQNISRDWFYTTDEDGFALCTLGQFESSVPEVLADDEEEDEDPRRSASPVPLDPPPNNEDFINLSIREQFVYTKTILYAILNDEYEPTRGKHSQFMKGGKQRASLTDEAALRGRMDPKDIEHLQTYIREWCLREEAPANIFVDEIENRVDNNNHRGARKDIQEEDEEPLLNPGVVVADRLHSGSPAPMEPVILSSPHRLPPSSSCPSVTLEREASLISDDDSFMVPTEPPSTLESEAPPRSPVTDLIPDKTTPGSIDIPLKHVKTRPAKQQGCEAYELLSQFDKIEYCLNVLLPEAVRQILLWRSGKRTSIELLSSAEEEELYQEGQTLLNETDWVFDILRYRQMKLRMLQSKAKNGSVSRTRRGFNAPSYIE